MKNLIQNDEGSALILVMIFGTILAVITLFLSGRSVQVQSDMLKAHNKSQVYYDREAIKFYLTNQPLPSPGP